MNNATDNERVTPPKRAFTADIAADFSTHQLAVAWATTVIIGAIVISLSPSINLARSLAPVLLMLLYIAYGHRITKKNTGRFADSVYFIGFLWTLYALIDALLRRGNTLEVNKISMAFGYALITTGAGMFFRLILMQFQYSVTDQIIAAREGIDEQLAELAGEAKRCADQLASVRHEADSAVSGWIAGLGKQTAALASEIKRAHQTGTEEAVKQISIALSGFESDVTSFRDTTIQMREQATLFLKKMSASTESLGRGLEKIETGLQLHDATINGAFSGFVRRINEISIPQDLISAKIESLIGNIAKTAKDLKEELQAGTLLVTNEITNLISSLVTSPARKEFDESLKKTSDTVFHLQKVYAALDASVIAVTGSLKEIAVRYDGAATSANAVDKAISALNDNVRAMDSETSKRTNAQIELIEASVTEVVKAGMQLEKTVAEVVTFIERRLTESA